MKKVILTVSLLLTIGFCKAQTEQKTCKGTTTEGKPCKSVFIPKDKDFCNAHNPEAITCIGVNAKKEPCRNKVKEHGDFCRFHKIKEVAE